MPLRGARAHVSRLRALASPEATRFIGAALFAGGELIQTEAQVSITRGSVSGKGHIPSKPGEPPNQNTGVLAGNIETTQTAPLVVEVSSNAPYSPRLSSALRRWPLAPSCAQHATRSARKWSRSCSRR